MTPTARSLKYLRKEGYLAEVVERWIPRVNLRRDLFRCIDLVAVQAGKPIVGVQTTTIGNLPSRVKKAKGIGALRVWLAAGGLFLVHGWKKENSGRWTVKVVQLKGEDLDAVVVEQPTRQRPRSRWKAVELFA